MSQKQNIGHIDVRPSRNEIESNPRNATRNMLTPPLRRYRYDVIRIICAIFVIAFHFDCDAQAVFADRSFEGLTVNWFGIPPLNAGNIAVGMFFILSGALSAKSINNVNVFGYYRRRFFRLYIPYYFSWILVCAYNLFTGKMFSGIPIARILLTVIGLDGYISKLSSGSIGTYYLVGEWFFGALIVCTILQPLISAAFRRFGLWTSAPIIIGDFVAYSLGWVSWVSPINCITLYVVGVAIGLLRAHRESPRNAISFIIGLCIVLFSISPAYHALRSLGITLPVCDMFSTGLFVVIDFFPFRITSHQFQGMRAMGNAVVVISGLTMYAFMFQHVAIMQAIPKLPSRAFADISDYFLTVLIIVIFIFLLAYVVSHLEMMLRKELSANSKR